MNAYNHIAVFTRGSGRKIALIDLRYPYGFTKKRVYMSGSMFTTAARFWESGWDVETIDFNIDTPRSRRTRTILNQADVLAISVVGAPYMTQLINFCRRVKRQWPNKKVLLGGQVMMAFSQEQFDQLFQNTNAVLIQKDDDLIPFGVATGFFPKALNVAMQPVLERLDDSRLKTYLSVEMPLVLSQGCIFSCEFCAADIGIPESFKGILSFARDLGFMANKAREFGLTKLEFYATNLDFFQNPDKLESYLRVIADVRLRTGMNIKVRALACLSSFLFADKKIAGLGELLKQAGFWCVGFGVDGPNEEIWKGQHKAQNHEEDIPIVLKRTLEMGLVTEILMIMGDKRYTPNLLIKTVLVCYGFVTDWPHAVLRMHVAKILPGSKEWHKPSSQQYVKRLLQEPSQFSNLDVLALASPITHPDRKHRWQVNLAYLLVLLPLRWYKKKCVSSTLIPQGGYGPLALLARLINPRMPHDR